MPSFFIETFHVPLFLLPIYQQAAWRYRVPWEVLAAINEVETDYGRDLNISSAGAEGWMQFMPGTWSEYGVDATGKGVRDPYDPADAIFAAARYLQAANAARDLRGAIFAYNHSEVYVESVIMRARLLAGTPPAMLNALAAFARHRERGRGSKQWQALIARLSALPAPRVPAAPTSASLPDRPGGVDLPPAGAGSLGQLAAGLGGLGASGGGGAPGLTGAGAGLTGAGGSGLAAYAAAAPAPTFQPVIGLPSREVQLLGTAPAEVAGEPDVVWAQAHIGAVPATVAGQQIANATVLLRYAPASGWGIVPLADAQGNALSFTPAAAKVSAGGGIVLLGSDGAGKQSILTRHAGGAFSEAPLPSASGPEAVLGAGEQLFQAGSSSAPEMVAALDEPGAPAHTGALIVPQAIAGAPGGPGLPAGLLRYDGAHWTREPICAQETGPSCTPPPEASLLALAAEDPQGAWLLGSSSGQPLMLFKRIRTGSEVFWRLQHPSGWMFGAGSPPAGLSVFARPAGAGPMLTVTSQGVWVDATFSLAGQSGDLSAFVPAQSPAGAGAPWCYPSLPEGCAGTLAAPLPVGGYQSVAWPGGSSGGGGGSGGSGGGVGGSGGGSGSGSGGGGGGGGGADLGTRVISGLPRGALLSFAGGRFSYATGGGGVGASSAAFLSPQEGWLAGASGSVFGNLNFHHGAQLLHLTTRPSPDQLQSWPAPFRRPLTAIAGEPGKTPGEPGAQALAVGDFGQVARYLPGQGWTPEFLYDGSGRRREPSLRGVAWPEPGRAYAVGGGGEMWLWRGDTGLWEPDPAKPLSFHANLTAVAFSPSNASVGYAVGKQGVLLSYGKTWELQAPPAGLEQATFTSVAFAGSEAIAGYRLLSSPGHETGGLIFNSGDGSGWHVDNGAQQLLAQLSSQDETVISKVAGLPDGGAVAAGPGVVIERDSAAGAPWRFTSQPLPEAANIAALASVRDGSVVRALISIDTHLNSLPDGTLLQELDNPPSAAAGQPALFLKPDPLPVTGYLLREGPNGWEDTEGSSFPEPEAQNEQNLDLPNWPDPVLALLVDPTARQGWAVGGQTGAFLAQSSLSAAGPAVQTAAVLRLGGGIAPPASTGAPIPATPGEATFAVGGNAQCADPCADYASVGLGPDAWLSSALSRAGQVPGLHAFLYTGARLGQGGGALSADAFQREMNAYAGLLDGGGPGVAGAGAGLTGGGAGLAGAAVPGVAAYAAASPSDIDPGGGLGTFTGTLGAAAPAGSVPHGTPAPPPGSAAYAFDSPGNGGTVRVIVLDYSHLALGAAQLQWLASQLDAAHAAGVPALVLGNGDPFEPSAFNFARDAAALTQTLTQHGASAYLYDSPGRNRVDALGSGSAIVPAYGTGTLGYVLPPAPNQEDFLGAGGILLTGVNVAARDPGSNRAPVSVTLVPNISQLALDATNGTLLRRSQVALFAGLARRPLGGEEQQGAGTNELEAPDPYVPIPEICQGAACGHFLAPAYSFSSSRPDIGDFVAQDPNNANPRAVLQGHSGKPIPDAASGLFCAFNAGTTTVTIQTGGLSYSEQVTVQAGSVEQPCGTVPLVNPPSRVQGAGATAPPPPAGSPPAGSTAAPLTLPPPPLPPAAPAPRPLPAPHPAVHQPPPPFFAVAPPVAALAVAPFPPPPAAARPTPPSGTSAVFGQALAPKEEQEDEEAVESARANMAAYSPDDPHLPPAAILALILVAAGAGTSIVRVGRNRRSRGAPAFVAVGKRTSG